MADNYTAPARPMSAPQPAQNSDPSQVSGQDPNSLFGMPVSYDSGAAGTAGAGDPGSPQDPTNMPNQYPSTEPISGVALGGSGAPGSQPPDPHGHQGAAVQQVTDPGPTLSGPVGGAPGTQQVGVPVAISGPGDSTAPAGNYPPAVPIVKGVTIPADSGAGRGNVRRGGFVNGQRG